MSCTKLKETLNNSIYKICSDIDSYVYNPGKDYSRVRKLPAENVISYLISQGGSSTKCEFLDFYMLSPETPTVSALNQRRSQLRPDAFKAVFHEFTNSYMESETVQYDSDYQYIATDGSTISFSSLPRFASDEYYISEGHSASGFYSMHINALYDLNRHIYTDALIQPAHQKDEFAAFCSLVDRHLLVPYTKSIFIGDRGYCSYNNMAHVIEKEQYFLFRTKAIYSKGLIGNFDFPDTDEFDITVHVTLTRSHRKTIQVPEGYYRRYVDHAASFDYIKYGSEDTYNLKFRIVRFSISEDSYECIVTNLAKESFPPEKIKEVYNLRWGIETSFRKLKYTIGLSFYHSYKPDFIKQEIWAKLIAYNATEFMINTTIYSQGNCKYTYAINFSVAAHICRIYLRLLTEVESIDVMALLKKELIPVRPGRQFPRLKTAHFRKPKYLIYRAA